MAEAAIILVLDSLRELVSEHMDVIRSVEGELKQLEGQLQMLRAFLQEQQKKGEAWRRLEGEIRDLVYVAEDVIDTFLTRAVTVKFNNRNFKPSHFWPSFLRLNCYGLTFTESDGLRSVIDGVRNVLEQDTAPGAQVPEIEQKRNSSLNEIKVVGFEDELANLLGYLKVQPEEFDVISLVGAPGIGKTTLASMIYENPTIKKRFPTLVWVTVSQEFSTKDLFASVFPDLDEKNMPPLTDSMLADIVRHRLDNSTFLIVVDGVHTIDDWRAIEIALPKTNRFGKVLLTTHDEKLARQANPKRDPHMLRSLNINESSKLFKLSIFNEPDKCPSHLETIAEEIISKCGGLPLAIVSIARILRETDKMDEWKKVSDGVDTYLRENQARSMENVIELSYNKLPNHLRDCFLYMGMFPEETKIPAWKLIRLWIAEGFIQINPRKSLEEVAENHLNDLIDRNLVIVDETKVEGGIKTCHIPSMIREFCKHQAEFEVPNMFKEVHRGDFEINDKCRRLCVHSDVVDFLRRNPHGEVVRSFLCFSKESANLPAECTQSIPEAFNLLRVLDASPIKFLKFSRKLAGLVHLRYIAISCDGFNSLPKAVSNFRNLQTIVINTALPTLKIKASVWKEMRVRHLKTKAAIVINKAAEGRAAENLQTLSRLAAKCVTEDFCRKAFNLKKLVIRGQLKNLLEKNCLSRLDRLRKLKLVHDAHPREASEDTLIRLPPREAFPPNLLILEMSSTFLEWNQMATLGMLPILEVLKLKEHAFVGKEWNAVGGGFPYLETLLIATTDLEVWTVSGDPFPALRNLVTKECDKLTAIPAELLKYIPADESMNANVPLATRDGEDADIESVTSMVKVYSPSLISIRGMVDPDANELLETLRDLLIERVNYVSDVDHDVKEVEENLRTIHGFLMEADNNRGRSDLPDLKNCIAQLRELAHEAEDALVTYPFHDVMNKIQLIRSGLYHLTNRLFLIFGGEKRLPNSPHQERLRCVNDVQQHFVGRKNDFDYLVSMVMDDSFHAPQIISICGMAGLGKTTLARKIYHHKDVQGHFDELAWVCATQSHAENILREIIEKFNGQISDMRLDALVKGLYSILGRGRYLIVIDDIWKVNHLDIIRQAIPKTCKVLLTTRSEKIASHECHVHNLGFLSEDEGWELIAKLSFQINDDETQVLEKIPGSFEDIGRHLVWKCSYLPLAISVIGGILRQKKPMLADWMEVSINMDFYCSHEREDVSNDTRVKRILDLSFDVLPYYLKRCFLYLASFPLGQDIYTEQLYLLWMAEGLISTEDKGNNETLRDVAERYLNELAFRSMIQVKSHFNTPYLKLKSCRLHDRMYDLCSSKLEQEKFIKRVHVSKYNNIPPAIEGSIHRLAINLDDDDDATTLSKIYIWGHEDLRSILLLRKHEFGLREIDFQNIVNFGNQEYLRILYLYGAKFEDENLPSTIGDLLRLKYLSLYRCKVRELPEDVCYLPFLEILDLRVSGDIEFKLPNHIYLLKRLKHLFLPSRIEVIGGDKLKLNGLKELETLEGINSTSIDVSDVITLTSLRSLTVAIQGDMDGELMIVDYMRSSRCKLRETDFTIKYCDLGDVFMEMLMLDSLISLHLIKCEIENTFPSYKQGMCPNLLRLEIKYSIIEAELIEVLGRFPVLQFLLLEGIAGEEKMIFGANSFPELKVLTLAGLMNLHKWKVEIGALPKLEGLYILDCRNLEKLPNELRFIPVLQSLQCTFVSEEFKKRYTRGGENGEDEGQDYADFSHIPRLSIS